MSGSGSFFKFLCIVSFPIFPLGTSDEKSSLFRGAVFRRGRVRANGGEGDLQRAQLAPVGLDRVGRVLRVPLHPRAQN